MIENYDLELALLASVEAPLLNRVLKQNPRDLEGCKLRIREIYLPISPDDSFYPILGDTIASGAGKLNATVKAALFELLGEEKVTFKKGKYHKIRQ